MLTASARAEIRFFYFQPDGLDVNSRRRSPRQSAKTDWTPEGSAIDASQIKTPLGRPRWGRKPLRDCPGGFAPGY